MSEPAKPVSQEGPGGTMDHLDEMTCLLYAERQLDRARAQAVSAHTQDCAACRTLLRALDRESRLAYARHAGGRRAAAVAAGGISRTRAEIVWMDLGRGFRLGGYWRLRALHGTCRALAGAIGASGIRRHEPFELTYFSRRLLERMAIRDHTSRGAGDANCGRIWRGCIPASPAARLGIGAGAGGILRRACLARACGSHGVS